MPEYQEMLLHKYIEIFYQIAAIAFIGTIAVFPFYIAYCAYKAFKMTKDLTSTDKH